MIKIMQQAITTEHQAVTTVRHSKGKKVMTRKKYKKGMLYKMKYMSLSFLKPTLSSTWSLDCPMMRSKIASLTSMKKLDTSQGQKRIKDAKEMRYVIIVF